MIDEQIRDGDVVVVESRPDARDGETVVALVRGADATLKKLFRRGSQVRLQPANPRMGPIDLPAADVEVRGVVRGLIRQLLTHPDRLVWRNRSTSPRNPRVPTFA